MTVVVLFASVKFFFPHHYSIKQLTFSNSLQKRSQYSNESPSEPNLAEPNVHREQFNKSVAESVSSKLPDVDKETGVISPSEEHGRSETDDVISELERKCCKREKKLQHKHLEKIKEFNKIWDEKREQLNKDLQLETAFIQCVFSEGSVRMERLKRMNEAFACKIDKHNLMRDVELKNLEAEQLAAMNKEKEKVEHWLTAAKACNTEPIAVFNAGVSQLEINTTVDATRVVSELAEQVADKNACESESTRYYQDHNFNVNDSPRHLKDLIPSETESTQHLEHQNPSGSVCAIGSAPAPANTSISTRSYPVHCDIPTEMRNLVTSEFQNEVLEKDIDGSSSDKIEPIPSGNLPPGFDPSTRRSVFVGNVQIQVTEPLLRDVFAITGPIVSCQLIRKEKSSCWHVHYFDRGSAEIAILSLNGRHLFGQPIKVTWAQREDTSSHYHIYVGGLSSEVTDDMLYAIFLGYPSCSNARIMWNNTRRPIGFVSFRNRQEAQSAINDLTGKWLGRRQLRCDWATKGAGTRYYKPNLDAKSVVELTNGYSGQLIGEQIII